MVLQALRDLLVVPKQFFETRGTEAVLWPAIGAVLLNGLVSLVGFVLLMGTVAADAGPEFERALRSAGFLLAVFILLATFLVWALLAGVVHLLVRNHAGSATYGRTFAVVGLAALVEIPVMLVGLVDAYLLFEATSFADPQRAARQVEAATDGRRPVVLLLWVGTTLWQGYIWRDGLRGAYDLDVDRANLAAGAAVVVSLLFVAFG